MVSTSLLIHPASSEAGEDSTATADIAVTSRSPTPSGRNAHREKVHVAIRVRPKLALEAKESVCTCVKIHSETELSISDGAKGVERRFTFDFVLGDNVTQQKFFTKTCKMIIENFTDGFNGTIFAYGQTGSGKTFTTYGNAQNPGVAYQTATHIDRYIKSKAQTIESDVFVSLLEIYNEKLIDLLAPQTAANKLRIHEDKVKGVFVKGLSKREVDSGADIVSILEEGSRKRHVGKTNMNDESSRSHSILSITLEQREKSDTEGLQVKSSDMHLVDLAGSERAASTGAKGERLKEGSKINQSLTALGHVIKNLVEGKAHVPYRNSVLTRLLQQSLGGNSKTLMINNLSPVESSASESLSTLRFAARAKLIENRPTQFIDPKMRRIAELKAEVAALKAELARVDQKCCTIL